jgi:tetratricopeptide (TPR) repeat protein
MSLPSSAALAKALACHQRGELDGAASLYRDILSAEPHHADALHLLGVVSLQRGQPRQAIELIERALALRPSVAAYHANLSEAYRAAGEMGRAAACAEIALRLQPVYPEAANNFGSLLMQMGRIAEAAERFRQAVRDRPDFALAHNNLGNACRVQGDLDSAITHFRRAVELDPHLAFAHGNLGQLLLECGRLGESLHHCQEAVRLEPQSAPAHNNLGNVFRALGQRTEAKAAYTRALQLAPKLGMVHNNLAEILHEEGNLDEAQRWFGLALQLDPNSIRAHASLGKLLLERLDLASAESHLLAAQRLDPDNAETRLALAALRTEQGRLEEARTEYRALLEMNPNHAVINCHLAEVLMELNQREEALACYRAALRGQPGYTSALAELAKQLGADLPAEEFETLRQRLAEPGLPDAERAQLLFGLAHIQDARGEYERAAEHLNQANALERDIRRRRGDAYNVEAHARFVDRLLTVFTSSFFERVRGFGVDSERPVFIVGLPRSGTTLLEQILSSHSRVFGAGELRLAREDFETLGRTPEGIDETRAFDILEGIDAGAVRRLAQTHLDKLHAVNDTADRVTDKMPDNYMYVGLMAMLFPRARFLHCRRDLRDVAVSCWMTQFRAIPWANDAGDLAMRFAQYRRIMEHWRRVLPVPVLDVDYEDLVNDLEGTARRVLAFCGLEWEPACLNFHTASRPVRTASVAQVRKPIYRRSVARWKHYESALRPLFARLDAPAGGNGP